MIQHLPSRDSTSLGRKLLASPPAAAGPVRTWQAILKFRWEAGPFGEVLPP